MRDEEQSRQRRKLGGQAPIVKGSDNSLAGTGCRHQEVPMAAVNDALDLELVEHLLLVRVGTNLQARECQGHSVVEPLAGRFGQGVVQPVAVGVGVVTLEGRVVPVAVERREELSQQRGCRHGRKAHVPLDAVEHRRAGEVAGADIGRVEAGVTPEEPSLRVEPRSLCVVLHLDLGSEVPHKPVQGRPLSGPHVGRRDQAEGDPALARCLKSVLEEA